MSALTIECAPRQGGLRPEPWRAIVARDLAAADAGQPEAGKINTTLSIAVALLARRQTKAAVKVATSVGVGEAGLRAGLRMMLEPAAEQMREQHDSALVVSAAGSVDIEVEACRVLSRVIDPAPGESLVGAWRSGWAAAVLCREPGAGLTGEEHAAALEGADAFTRRFADFMAVKGAG